MLKKLVLSLLFIGTLLHATPPTEETITRLYIATFDRAPDAKGLSYWLNDSGLDLEGIAISFFDQDETKEKYPSGFSHADFIQAIYKNLFKRDADSEGFEYWYVELEDKKIGRSVFILAIINGALGNDAKVLAHKLIVGLKFARAKRDDLAEAKEIMTTITANPATVNPALCYHTLARCYVPPKPKESSEVTASASPEEDEIVVEEKEKTSSTASSTASSGGSSGGSSGNSSNASNTAPIATAQSITLIEDSTANVITLAGTDADGDTLNFTVETQPTHGALSGTAPNITYTPTANYFGADSFIFKVNDGTIDSSSATVTITVTDVAEPNNAPVANAQSITVDEDSTNSTITLTGTDPENNALTYTIVNNPSNGSLDVTALPIVQYTPSANYAGADSFTFKVNDGNLDSTVATVTITITDVNEKPIAYAGSDQTDTEAGETIHLNGSGSSDADNDTLTYVWSITTKPTDSTASLSDVTAEYPSFTADKAGTYVISLVVNDETEDSVADTVTITTIESECVASNDIITGDGIEYKEVCSPHTQKIWLDRNLGASQVCTALDDGSCYGDYYQWGRDADGHEKSNSDTGGAIVTSEANLNNVGIEFIKNGSSPYDWASVDGDGAIRTANLLKTDGSSVCPANYRVPTEAELTAETTGVDITDNATAFSSFLKLPSAGYRYSSSGSLLNQGSWGGLWSASVDSSKSRSLDFGSSDAYWGGSNRAYGQAVRCIKDDTPVVVATADCPDGSSYITHHGFDYCPVTSDNGTGNVWLDRNLGAAQVCTAFDDTACYGDYYQWGRNADGHEDSMSATTDVLATNVTNAGTTNFITNDSNSYDWASVDEDGAIRIENWSKTDATSVCPTGYRVPTKDELTAETTGADVTNGATAFSSFLKLPSAGFHENSDGSLVLQGSWGSVWSASVDGSSSHEFYFTEGAASLHLDPRAYGLSVRCLKNREAT